MDKGDHVHSRRPEDIPLEARTVVHELLPAVGGHPPRVLLRAEGDSSGLDLLLVAESEVEVDP